MNLFDAKNELLNKALVGILLLGGWYLMALFYPHYFLPSPIELIDATQQVIENPEFGTYPGNIADTMRRLLAGFLISVVVGGLLGSLMGFREDAEALLRPWVVFGLSVPAIAVAFSLIIAIGINEWVPVLTVTIVGIPFVMLNMWEGTQDMDFAIGQMADFYGASRFQKVRHVILPQLLQYLFPSMYWALIVSWKVLFLAEVFGAGSGVGYMVNYWFLQQRVDLLLGWVVGPTVIIILAQEGIRFAEHRIMAWR